MMQRTWVILGATSIIAERFAHLAAKSGHCLRLVGRQQEQLELIAKDIQLRYQVACEAIVMDMTTPPQKLIPVLESDDKELDLFIAHSDFTENEHLNTQKISELIKINIEATVVIINAYFNRKQAEHNLVYLSSVAACRGRAKNSLYGASKACIEIYLQGLQQAASNNQHITVARLGFIDTKQTYGQPGIFYAGSPDSCAKACWNALLKRKRLFYYPFFWQFIMCVISNLPFFIYKKLKV